MEDVAQPEHLGAVVVGAIAFDLVVATDAVVSLLAGPLHIIAVGLEVALASLAAGAQPAQAAAFVAASVLLGVVVLAHYFDGEAES